MIGNKSDIEKALVFSDNKVEYLLLQLPITSEQRTKCQNSTFYRLFSEIGMKLWYSAEETKQALMKWVFGTKVIKMWGMQFEVAIIWSTAKLTKEQAILLIERGIEFWKKLGCWSIITPRELNLIYNN